MQIRRTVKSKPLGMFGFLLIALCGSLLLTACGQTGVEQAAENAGTALETGVEAEVMLLSQSSEDNELNGPRLPRATRTPLPVTPTGTRAVSTTPTTTEGAKTALATWASGSLGLTPTYTEAKGVTRQVLASYDIVTQQRGIIEANINASRAGYIGKVQNGGYSVLLLGGGSSLSNANLNVQIQSASLGYLQLPASTYPTSSEAALTQLKQAFPALSGYAFTAVETPNGNRNTYSFYATKTQTVPGNPPTTVKTGVSTGVIKIGERIWVYAMVGTGSFAPSVAK